MCAAMCRFIVLPLLVFVLGLVYSNVSAQEITKTPAPQIVYGKSQALFFELGGQGLIYSFNYDTRFLRQHAGWGYRFGLGALTIGGSDDKFSYVAFPLSVNHLLGKGRWALETGLGATIVNTKSETQSEILGQLYNEGYTFLAVGTLGIRYHPTQQGLMARFAYTPVLGQNGIFLPVWLGLTIGYGFHN